MNRISGKISHIEVQGGLSLVKVDTTAGQLSAIVIDSPETCAYLKQGKDIQAIFKETEVVIGTGSQEQISLQNKLKGPIISLQKGALLSKVVINTAAGSVASHITTNALNQLGLKEGMEVWAMIKTNEVMLAE